MQSFFLSFFLRQGLVAVRQQARLESKDLVQECVWCKRKRAGDGDRLIEGGGERQPFSSPRDTVYDMFVHVHVAIFI